MGVIADKIRRTIFGGEVRDSIADGIEVVEQLREDYDNQVINAGNSNAEIVDARGNYVKLKERLDKEHGEVISQLDKKASKDEVRYNSTLITMADLSNEVKQSMTGGSTAVVGKGVINSENIIAKAINQYHLSCANRTSSNLIDKDSLINGYFKTDGSIIQDSSYKTTKYIPITPKQQYYKNSGLYTYIWDNSFNYLTDIPLGTTEFIAPDNASYITITFESWQGEPRLVLLNDKNKPYENFNFEIPTLKVNNSNLSEDFKFVLNKNIIDNKNLKTNCIKEHNLDYIIKNSVNLVDKDKLIPGYFSGSGLVNDINYKTTDFIPVEPNTNYYKNSSLYAILWDSEYNYILSLPLSTFDFTTTAETKYITITYDNYETQPMLVLAEDKEKPYENFSYKIPALRIDNSNLSKDFKISTSTRLNGLKWIALGDSITARPNGYVKIISDQEGMSYVNMGLDGRTWTSRGDEADAIYPPIVNIIDTIPDGGDIITVACGTNDYSQVGIGNINSENPLELYGALNIASQKLIKKFPGKLIAYLTPIQRKGYDVESFKAVTKAIEDIGEKYGIPVLNQMKVCGLCPNIDEINQQFFDRADGLHPNDEGHKIMARAIRGFLESII